MEQDKMREEALTKIAEEWREAAAMGCVDAFECALREAWQASREALVVELPEPVPFRSREDTIQDCRTAIHAAGIRTK